MAEGERVYLRPEAFEGMFLKRRQPYLHLHPSSRPLHECGNTEMADWVFVAETGQAVDVSLRINGGQ